MLHLLKFLLFWAPLFPTKLLDNYLWGFTVSNRDINISLAWGTVLFVICIGLTSEPIVAFVDRKIKNKRVLFLLGCFRTWILAWGTVSLWRVVWFTWDQFLPGPTYGSCWLSHAIGVVVLLCIGAVTCIVAPASTIGVDAVPHPFCADEPLFSMIPLPYETLYFLGIARQEWERKEDIIPSTMHERREVELAPVEEDKAELPSAEVSAGDQDKIQTDEEAEAAKSGSSGSKRNMLQSVRSWRPGPDGGVVSYHELQRPGLGDRTCSEYAQRPSDSNKRSRTKLFRSR